MEGTNIKQYNAASTSHQSHHLLSWHWGFAATTSIAFTHCCLCLCWCWTSWLTDELVFCQWADAYSLLKPGKGVGVFALEWCPLAKQASGKIGSVRIMVGFERAVSSTVMFRPFWCVCTEGWLVVVYSFRRWSQWTKVLTSDHKIFYETEFLVREISRRHRK